MIPTPMPPTSDEFALKEQRTIGGRKYTVILAQCPVETSIDREGMNDMQCSLRADHSGPWHYVEPDQFGSDEVWFRKGKD